MTESAQNTPCLFTQLHGPWLFQVGVHTNLARLLVSPGCVLCACLSSHLVVNMKHSAGKSHNFALDHLTYIPSPLPVHGATGGKEGRDHHQAGSNKIHSLAVANIHSLCLKALHAFRGAQRQCLSSQTTKMA